ncbi:parallel beta-helix repeat (two copies) [Thermoplasmatales archaeon SCGC AB-540-F20]|nr:parallel beta-helix repeat (two copies) [Thermoplasmatales archaeon SCGC AB-540-F20]
MQNSLVRKGLVLGVILLFVGASGLPNIAGNLSIRNNIDVEGNIQNKDLSEEYPINIKDDEGIGEGNYQHIREPEILFNESKNTYSDKELNCKSLFDRGTTLYVGGTGPNNYTKIQDAINDASDGYTVFVYNDSSPYYESIIIDKSINLVGEDRDSTHIAGGGGNVALNGLAFDPTTDKLFGASGDSFYEINMEFGNQIYIGDFNTGGAMIAISFDNLGNCFGVDIGTDSLYSIDTESGEASLIGSFGINLNYAQDCAYDRDNEIFYLSAYTLGADEKGVDDDRASGEISRSGGELYICDTETANLTLVGTFENGAEITGFAIPYNQGMEFDRILGVNRFPNKLNFRGSRYEPFYGYCAYDPGGHMSDYTINFNSDSPENLSTISYTQSNSFIAGATWVNDTWYGVEYYTGQLYSIDSDNGDMNAIGYNRDVFGVSADWVNISGFTIGKDWNSYAAGICIRSNYNTINGNKIIKLQDGIELEKSRDNTITGNTISSNMDYGICLSDSINNTINSNNITDNEYGITFYSSCGNTIVGNNITDNDGGMFLYSSKNNTVYDNVFFNDGLNVSSNSLQNKVYNNSVNGKPLEYLDGESDMIIDDAGQVILINCDNITVINLNISYIEVGISLWYAQNCLISGNTISNSRYGLFIYSSKQNTIIANNITENGYSGDGGIYLYSSCSNTITGNNISSNDNYNLYLSSCQNNTIVDNNITNIGDEWQRPSSDGIYLLKSSNNNITRNTITKIGYDWSLDSGIYFYKSDNNIIFDNVISNNNQGIYLDLSNNNTILENDFINDSLIVHHSYLNTIVNNMVNGKPLIYLEEKSNMIIDDEVGQVILVNCDNITILNQNISNIEVAISLWHSHCCLISNNNISNNRYGLDLYSSWDNIITGNNISDHGAYQKSGVGINLNRSSYNIISFNDIVSNLEGLNILRSNNITITNNNIKDNWGNGIKIYEGSNYDIFENNIINSGWEWIFACGIYSIKSSNLTINNNYIAGSRNYGIGLSSSSNNNIITCNIITGNRGDAILIQLYSNNNLVIDNNISYNGGGVFVGDSSSNTITGNIIWHTWYEGIGLYFSRNNIVLNNSISHSGVYIYDSYHTT